MNNRTLNLAAFWVALATTLATACVMPGLAQAKSFFPAPNWDARLAAESASLPRAEAELRDLFALMRAGNLDALQVRLDSLIAGSAMTQPERDAILFRFTRGLGDIEYVDPGLVERLKGVRPSVFVAHPERASVGVPLYDIAGAAEGVYQLNLRRDAHDQARYALDDSPQDWVDQYLFAGASERRGFVDALDLAADAALTGILRASLPMLSFSPELTAVAGKSALLLRDRRALQRIAAEGQGPELAYILEAAGEVLPAEDAFHLLSFALDEAPASNAALAIARIFPRVVEYPGAIELMLNQLANAEFGSAAALALAQADSAQSRVRLRDVAANGEGLAARRAQAALGMTRPFGASR